MDGRAQVGCMRVGGWEHRERVGMRECMQETERGDGEKGWSIGKGT